MSKNTNCAEWIVNIITKDWSKDVDLAFKKLNGLFGVEYKPVAQLATQLVAGTNYAVLAKQNIIQNPIVKKNVLIVFYARPNASNTSDIEIHTIQPIPHGSTTIIIPENHQIDISHLILESQEKNDSEIVGGWELDFSATVWPKEVNLAINQLNKELGATYTVKEYLGKQVVKGINYAIIAEQTIMSADKTKKDVLIVFNVWNNKITIISIENPLKFNENTKTCGFEFDPTIDIPKEKLKEIDSFINNTACTERTRRSINSEVLWMNKISDSTPVNKLSIPGTHDTLTWDITNLLYNLAYLLGYYSGFFWLVAASVKARMKKFSQTQNSNFKDQLSYGCRYFDIRIDGKLQGCHGEQPIGVTCEYNLYNVMDDVKTFLEQHPKEFIIMRIKNDRDNVEKKKINELIGKYKNLFWTRSKNSNTEKDNYWPLLKDARGKIIVLDQLNDSPFFSHPEGYGFQYPPDEGNNLFYKPQDEYEKPDINHKLSLIIDNINYSKDSKKMKINHVSATGMASDFVIGFFRKTPGEYAEYLNPRVVDYLKRKQKCITGLLIFDYITSDIAKVVIAKNTF